MQRHNVCLLIVAPVIWQTKLLGLSCFLKDGLKSSLDSKNYISYQLNATSGNHLWYTKKI